jgi:prolyl 4-hydroxylase
MNLIFILLLLLILCFIIIFYSFFHRTTRSQTEKSSSSQPRPYKVLEYPNLLSVQECDEIIELSKKNGLQQSYIVSDEKLNAYDLNFRKSDQTWMSRDSHSVLEKLSKISERLTGLPQANQEMVQVVRYEKGGKFDAHFDPCVKGEQLCKEMNRGAGQRRTTLLVYLNDVLKGGETEFVNLGVKVKPEKGKGILFWSTDENERVLDESKHRGCEVLEGEKWIATIWSHPMMYQ